MRLPGRRWMERTLNRLRARLTGSPVILGYHRVTGEGPDPLGLAVCPANFAAHMEWLALRASPIDLRTALRGTEGRAPGRGVAVTFDDGYHGTAAAVLPVLERFEIPATVFVTTGPPGAEFWWDEVVRLLRAAPPGTARLRLALRGRAHAFAVPDGSAAARARPATAIIDLLRPVSAVERDEAMAALREQIPGAGAPPAHRALGAAELERLASHPLISIGAHSMTHPVLPLQNAADQAREIRGSRAALEIATGTAVSMFSYPNGRFSRQTVELVREAGFECACCSRPGAVVPRSDLFALPRLWSRNVDGPHFAHWAGRWVHG